MSTDVLTGRLKDVYTIHGTHIGYTSAMHGIHMYACIMRGTCMKT